VCVKCDFAVKRVAGASGEKYDIDFEDNFQKSW